MPSITSVNGGHNYNITYEGRKKSVDLSYAMFNLITSFDLPYAKIEEYLNEEFSFSSGRDVYIACKNFKEGRIGTETAHVELFPDEKLYRVTYASSEESKEITYAEMWLIRESPGTYSIPMIKFLRGQYTLGLLDAKRIVDTVRDKSIFVQ